MQSSSISLPNTALTVADELRRAERSISIATRDTAQFLVTALDASEAHGLSAAMSHQTVKATVGALSALVEGQGQMAMRAHPATERVARQLGFDETAFGELLPKPAPQTADIRNSIAA